MHAQKRMKTTHNFKQIQTDGVQRNQNSVSSNECIRCQCIII
jgi:hypothetical protein